MTELLKGPSMEEQIRSYFIQSGYYTLRGVKFVYGRFDVTDIDLWLYDRPSPVSRQRIIVDIKNKKTPQAIERIFWAKGVQNTLGLDQAIVATTDKRPDVGQFGRQHGVVVLDGKFLARLSRRNDSIDRISEEQLLADIASYPLAKLGGNWKNRLEESKSLVLDGLGYDQVNQWLAEGRYFAEQVLLVTTHRQIVTRLLYILASLTAIGLDFILRELAFSDQAEKVESINNGLRYGSAGAGGAYRAVDMAIGLIDQYSPEQKAIGGKIRNHLQVDFNKVPTQILAEYFARSSAGKSLYFVARDLEAAAYGVKFRAPGDLSVEAKSMVAVLLDFWGIDRVRFLGTLRSDAGLVSTTSDRPASQSTPNLFE